MTLALIEDVMLYRLAEEVVPECGSGVNNAQIAGLLSAIRASASYAVLRNMTQKQREKARKEGERGAGRASFYERLFNALQKVDKTASDYAQAQCDANATTAELKRKKLHWSGRFALTLMTHVAAEHRWRWKGNSQ